jgi:hypothetical protein
LLSHFDVPLDCGFTKSSSCLLSWSKSLLLRWSFLGLMLFQVSTHLLIEYISHTTGVEFGLDCSLMVTICAILLMGAYSLLDNGLNFCTSLPWFGWVILFHLARFHNFESYIGMCNFLINPLKNKIKTFYCFWLLVEIYLWANF